MDKRKILVQLDTDKHASLFDRVVAVDSEVDEIFTYAGVRPDDVRAIVHGAIFTRSPKSLKATALFIGGSDVAAAEAILAEALKHMLPQFGLRVSVLFDANGANTTAAAAVRAAERHLPLAETTALVLGGTGPVGQRAARLLARQGADVRVGSRQEARAAAVCQAIAARVPDARLKPVATGTSGETAAALEGCALVIAAGATGALLLPAAVRRAAKDLAVAIDLNAVPPLGIEGVAVSDKGDDLDGIRVYGAIGVGDTKMKVHKTAVARLFDRNDQVFDAEEVFEIAQEF